MTEFVTDFDLFWQAFPKRRAKADARKAWLKLRPSAELVQKILDALVWQSVQHDWVKADRAYCPLPATYLRGERWEDEPPTTIGSGRTDRLQGLREFVNGGHVH